MLWIKDQMFSQMRAQNMKRGRTIRCCISKKVNTGHSGNCSEVEIVDLHIIIMLHFKKVKRKSWIFLDNSNHRNDVGSHFDIREWVGKWFGLISSHFTSSQLFPHLETWEFLLSPLCFQLVSF